MIRVTDIHKRYGDLEVLKGVSLEVAQGEVVSIVGASGAGKTTLLQIMGTLSRPDGGRVEIDGQDVSSLGDRALSRFRNAHIGFVFQFHHLLPEFTAFENICIPALIGRRSRAEAERRATELLAMMGLEARGGHKPSELSGGEQQRVAIARAVVNKPLVLLLDEPFSALDYKLRRAMQLEIKRLQRRLGITFVFVTHDQEEAFAMSDRVVVMNQGRIEQIGTPQEIYEEPSNLYVARFVGEINILPARIMSVPGEGIYIADISGRRFTLRTSRPFAAGDRVNVLLRPEDIRVYAHDDERPEGPYLTGRIEETVYKGATVDISIALDSGETLSVAEFFNEDDAEISYNRGERVAVTWVDGWEVVLPYEAD